MTRQIDVPALVKGVLGGGRRVVARAITLVESRRRVTTGSVAQELLVELLPHAGGARRIGISGVPGVGKSTFIDQLGVDLTAAGSKVAVLAVDPSSARSGGSILGDKTRMARLAVDPHAFIRPSPDVRDARRGREGHPRVDRRGGGGRLRRRPGRDGRGRAVGDHRRGDGRLLPLPHPRPHRRPAAGHQARHPGDRRRHRRQQGRRAAPPRTRARPRASWPGRSGCCAGTPRTGGTCRC